MICKLCGRDIGEIAFGMHLKHKHQMDSREYYLKYVDSDAGSCKICGKPTYFFGPSRGFRKYCSDACAGKDPEIREKIEATNMKHCGSKCNLSNKENREKQYATCEKKYGNRFPQKTDIVKDKIKKTNQAKRGVDWFVQSDEFKSKSRETIIRKSDGKYTHNSQIPEVRKRMIVGFKKKHDQWLENYQTTCKERYGVTNPMQIPEFRKKTQHRYTFDGIKFDSKPEIAYFIWLRDTNREFTYQPDANFSYICKGKEHRYCPDFLVEGKYVEIKGKQFFEDGKMINPYCRDEDEEYEAKHQCMICNNVEIITNFDEYLDFVKSKYGNDFLDGLKVL